MKELVGTPIETPVSSVDKAMGAHCLSIEQNTALTERLYERLRRLLCLPTQQDDSQAKTETACGECIFISEIIHETEQLNANNQRLVEILDQLCI